MKFWLLLLVSVPTLACRMVCDGKSTEGEHLFILCYEKDDSHYKVILDNEDILRDLTCDFDPNDKLLSRCHLDHRWGQPSLITRRVARKEIQRSPKGAATTSMDTVEIEINHAGKHLKLISDQSKSDCTATDKNG